jgi:hypothetical protein
MRKIAAWGRFYPGRSPHFVIKFTKYEIYLHPASGEILSGKLDDQL